MHVCRFVYWTEHSTDGGTVSLHELNLRQTELASSTVLSTGSRRRRRRSTRDLINISLSPALAQDPLTAELLVCDASSGNIMRCNVTEGTCTVEVDHSGLLASSGLQNVGE